MKILVIRFSSIGDIVLTTPVLRCLKQQIGAEIHVLTKRVFQTVLEANPYVDRFHSMDQRVREVLPQLRLEQFDHVIDLHRNLRSWQVKRALGVPSSSFDKLNWQKWWLVRFKQNRLPELHIVDRYLAAGGALGLRYDGQGLDHFIPVAAKMDVQDYGLSVGNYIVFVIGAAHATKRLPPEKIASICGKLDTSIAIVGGPDDAVVGQALAEQYPGKVINLAGRMSIQQSASVIEQSRRVISHDTGMMHIAAALRKPVISVWGNTVPDFGMYPFYPEGLALETRVEVKGLACRPCSKIGYAACPKGHFRCMREIDEAFICRKAVGD